MTPPPIRATSRGAVTSEVYLRFSAALSRPKPPSGLRDRQARGDQFRDLNRIEGGTLAQVVVRDEHRKPVTLVSAPVAKGAAAKARASTGRVAGGRHVHMLPAVSRAQKLGRSFGAEGLFDLRVDRERVPCADLDAHAGAAHEKVGQFEDLAAL